MRKANLVILIIIVLSFIIGIWLHPDMPEMMPSHWNAAGQVDGYMPKFWGLLLMPLISLGLLLLFLAIPRIDPMKRNIEKFRGYFDGLVVLVIAFMFYLYLLMIFWSLGFRFNMMHMLVPALGFLFYYIGILLEHSKRNWFIGIRTPWTLSSDKVWEKTHKRGSILFKASGVIALIGILSGGYAIWFVLVPVIAAAIYLIVYSYFEYQK